MKNPIKVIIQSRMSSTRLPGKALLPVGGLPSVVLCAKRAANTGLDVCVATSECSSDDILCDTLDNHDISYVRGPLDNVFERYLVATEGLPDDSIIVRLTADNMFPDGAFIKYVAEQMEKRASGYMTTSSPECGLPYGLSVELFLLKELRRCAASSLNSFDREHVTPALRRKLGIVVAAMQSVLDWGHLRCTMDSFNDYQQVVSVFGDVDDPVQAGWLELCEILSSKQPDGFRIPCRKKAGSGEVIGRLTLGAAQLGIDNYGVVNEQGGVSQDEVNEIISLSIGHGVTTIDCARAYGNAETRVGTALEKLQRDDAEIITKLDPLAWLPEGAEEQMVRSAVDASVFRSCRELGVSKLPVLMLHRWMHRTSHRGTIWRRLQELKQEGVIGALGASVYFPSEALKAIANDEINHLQVPFNLLDKRWHSAGIPEKVGSRSNLTVYARSVFLQGVLLYPPSRWPVNFATNADHIHVALNRLVAELDRQSLADLCIAYVAGQEWIDSIILGVDSSEQLKENLRLFMCRPLLLEECVQVEKTLPETDEELLNPSAWN